MMLFVHHHIRFLPFFVSQSSRPSGAAPAARPLHGGRLQLHISGETLRWLEQNKWKDEIWGLWKEKTWYQWILYYDPVQMRAMLYYNPVQMGAMCGGCKHCKLVIGRGELGLEPAAKLVLSLSGFIIITTLIHWIPRSPHKWHVLDPARKQSFQGFN